MTPFAAARAQGQSSSMPVLSSRMAERFAKAAAR
jgi:hypothetical protein